MRVLFLDDDEMRHETARKNLVGHDARHVRTVAEFQAALSLGPFDVVFLDHDLGGEAYVPSGPGTGYEAALLLASREERPTVICHSYNRPGAIRIVGVLRSHGFSAVWLPFGPTTGQLSKWAEPHARPKQ
jgi:CheY-like chemotaxis protein